MIRVLAIALFIVGQGCTADRPEPRETPPLAPDEIRLRVQDMDPGRAAERARVRWAAGERHLLGVYSYSAIVPEAGPATANLPVLFIEGTSDVMEAPYGIRFNDRARDYARVYNIEVSRLAATSR